MLLGGEDLNYLLRRLVRFAAEDIGGLSESHLLVLQQLLGYHMSVLVALKGSSEVVIFLLPLPNRNRSIQHGKKLWLLLKRLLVNHH